MRLLQRPIAARVAAACRALGFSPRTAQSYGFRLVSFEDWTGMSAMEAGQEHAAAWLISSSVGWAQRCTVYHNRCALAFLWRHLRGEELDPRIVPRMRQPAPAVRRTPDPHEISRTMSCIDDPQVSLACHLIYGTGLRIGEALAARIADIDANDRSLLVRHAKGGRQRRTIMPDSLLRLVARSCRGWPPEALIATRDGRPDGPPLSPERVGAGLAAARRRAGTSAPENVHHLRHAFATHLHERGAGLVELQRILGHTSVSTTALYIGMREQRRADLARIGDLVSALPRVGQAPMQLLIWPG